MNDIIIKYFETTGRCNYNCPICVDRVRDFHMSQNDFYMLVDTNYHLFNPKGVWLDFSGEPLMDPHFFDRVKYLKSKNLKVRISTNGSLLSKKNRTQLIESEIDYVVISISTLNNEIYKKIRGIDALSSVLSNLMQLKKEIDDSNAKTELQAVMIDTCDGANKEEFIKYFHEKGIHVAFHNFTNRSKHIKMDLSSSDIHNFSLERGKCLGLKQNIGILSNCNVVTCCCDFSGENSLGNLRDYNYSLERLLRNGKLEELENNLEKHLYLGACKNCSDWIYYQKNSKEKYVTVFPVR